MLVAKPSGESDNEFKWLEGHKEVHHQEPKDWAFSSWVWHSNGHIDQEESIHSWENWRFANVTVL